MTDRLLEAKEVAELLSVPVGWVREHTRSGAIPCVELGRYRRYDRRRPARGRAATLRRRITRIQTHPGAIHLHDGDGQCAADQPATTPKVSGAAGLTVVITAEADKAIREFVDEGVEVCGGIYGKRDGNELRIENVTEIRDRFRSRSRTELDLRQLAQMETHFSRAGWDLYGDWHSHPEPGLPASGADKVGWLAQAGARSLPWLGLIAEPRSTWTGDDWYQPNDRAFIARPGSTDVSAANAVVEVAA